MFGEFQGMDLISWFPCVVAVRISDPFDKVLESLIMSVVSVVDGLFDLIFFFSIDKVRWWLGEVRAMCLCFMIQG